MDRKVAQGHAGGRGSLRGRSPISQGKLVRDKVPQIIRDGGGEPLVRVATADEFRKLLRAKLVEEVEEFLDSEEPEELADVLEVLLALAADLGLDRDALEKLRQTKASERGRFDDRVVWSDNQPAPSASGADGREANGDAEAARVLPDPADARRTRPL